MSNPLSPSVIEHFAARLLALNAQSKRLWGTLEPAPMLAHLRTSLEISLGRKTIKDESTFLSRTIIRFVALYLLPIPRGRIKAADSFFSSEVGSVEAERAKLVETLHEFMAAANAHPSRRTVHPFFGSLSLNQWRRLHGKHFDHHLRQFGM